MKDSDAVLRCREIAMGLGIIQVRLVSLAGVVPIPAEILRANAGLLGELSQALKEIEEEK